MREKSFQCEGLREGPRLPLLPLIRPSGTFSRWKKQEKAIFIEAFSSPFWREKVAEGWMRGTTYVLTHPNCRKSATKVLNSGNTS